MRSSFHTVGKRALPVLLSACLVGSAAAEIDYTKPGIRRLKTHYVAERDKQETTHFEELKTLAGGQLKHYEEMLTKQKRTGNITRMAVARGGIRIFEDCLEQLEKDKDFKLPERVRRELQRTTMDVARRKQKLDADHALALAVLRRTYYARFLDLCREQGADTSDQAVMEQAFDDLMGGKIKTATEPEPGTEPEAEPGAEPGELPQVQSNTNDVSEWATFGYWGAEINSMEVFRIAVFNRSKPEKNSGQSMVGSPYRTEFQPVRILPPGRGYAFQLKKMGKRLGVDVVEWPSRRNQWQLVVRARPTRGVPSRHAVELKVGFDGALKLARADGAAGGEEEREPGDTAGGEPDKETPPVPIRIETLPENAEIEVDGVRQKKKDKVLTTPCTVEIPAGRHDIRLERFGFHTVTFRNYEVQPGKRIAVRLVKNPAFKERTISVTARGLWQNSGITLDAGDTVQIEAAGMWDCGGRNQGIGPKGYPNSQDFFHYYIDPIAHPRLTSKANYGALLMRIGKEGKIIPVSEFLRARIKKGGRLYLGINEGEGSARQDNTGSLSVRIQKGPGEGS